MRLTPIIGALACLGLASAADAADFGGSLKDDYSAPAGHNWTGFYLGAHGGIGWGDIDGKQFYCFDACQASKADPVMAALTHNDADLSGVFGGGQVGFNYQLGSVVVGLEADISASDIDGKARGETQVWNDPPDHKHVKTWAFELDRFYTVRGRIGLARDSALYYVTGGFAWGKVSSDLTSFQDHVDDNVDDFVSGRASWDKNLSGWTVGGGAEFALTQNLSVKAEYQYIDLGSFTANYKGTDLRDDSPWVGESFHGDVTVQTVRVGVNYRFGGR